MAVPHGLLVAAHAAEIRERVSAGEIGDLLLIEIECAGWDIINAGIHWLNFAYVLNAATPADYVMATCDASSRTYRDGVQVETMAVTYVQASNGVRIVMNTGDYVTTTRSGKDTVFHIVGSKGTIEFWAWESAYRIVSPAHPGGLLVEVAPAPVAGHRKHLERLAEQMDQGTTDYSVAESSLAALELCEAAYLASRYRCQVDLPLVSFAPPRRRATGIRGSRTPGLAVAGTAACYPRESEARGEQHRVWDRWGRLAQRVLPAHCEGPAQPLPGERGRRP